MNLEINKNINIVKKGMIDAIELFKIHYARNKNIIIQKDFLYLNNIEQMLTKDSGKDRHYLFGFNFVLDNINNFRYNICVNPILYLLCLEIIIDKIVSFDELKKYRGLFKKTNDFLLNYYKISSLAKAKINLEDIENNFANLLTDDFIKQVCEKVFEPSNIQIEENTINNIVNSKFYEIRATYISGKKYSEEPLSILFWSQNITKENINKLKDFVYSNNMKLIVVCSPLNEDISNYLKNFKNDIISFYQISNYNFLRSIDLIKLTEANNISYDGFMNFNDYIFGTVKKFIFNSGVLSIEGKKYFDKNDKSISYLNKKNTLDRYYMMQGKTLKISCKEEILENVRAIVSLVKSIYTEGIFYDISTTLKLLQLCLPNNFWNTLIGKYFMLNDINRTTIEEYINKKDLKNSLDFNTGKYVNKTFTALSIYLNTFGLLESNIEVMCKIF